MPLRPFHREQAWLLPPSLDELLPADHPARFVDAVLEGLGVEDWEALGINAGGDPLGASAYHPRALLGVWLYGFMTGTRSTPTSRGGGLPRPAALPVAYGLPAPGSQHAVAVLAGAPRADEGASAVYGAYCGGDGPCGLRLPGG